MARLELIPHIPFGNRTIVANAGHCTRRVTSDYYSHLVEMNAPVHVDSLT